MAGVFKQTFNFFSAIFSEGHIATFFVFFIIGFVQLEHDGMHLHVQF